MADQEQQLIDLVSLSTTLPPCHSPELERDAVIATLTQQFSAGYSSIALTGPIATGKTTILRQYVERFPADAVNLFMDPRSAYIGSYEIAVRELVSQLSFVSSGEVIDPEKATPALVRDLFPKVAQKRRLHGRKLTVVIDGLFDLEPSNPSLVSEILGLLPSNLNSLQFLFSCSSERLKEANRYWPTLRTQGLTGLNHDETAQLLSGLVDDHQQVVQLHDATDGHVGQLGSIVRILRDNGTVDEILSAKPKEIRQYYELEWGRVSFNTDKDRLALAAIVFLPSQFTLQEIAEISGCPISNVHELLEPISFIKLVEADGNQTPKIESHPFRRFLEEKMSDDRGRVIDSAVEYIKNDDHDKDPVEIIPGLLELKGDQRALAEYLAPEVIEHKLGTTGSVLAVTQALEKGFRAASNSKQHASSFFFSVLASGLHQLVDNPAIPKQVDYYVTYGEYENAITFARSIFSVESRLLALCKVCAQMTRSGRDVGHDLQQEIAGYIDEVSEIVPEEHALEVATQLVQFDQPLAADLLKAVARRSGEDNSFDWMIARLAHESLRNRDTQAYEQIYESLAEKTSDSTRQQLSLVRELFRTSQDSRQLVRQIRSLDSTEQKVFLARAYMSGEAAPDEKVRLALAVAEELVADQSYSPNAGVYAELTDVLLSEGGRDSRGQKLVTLTNAQLRNIAARGPTPAYYRVRLNLICAETAEIPETFCDRLFDLIVELEAERLEPDVQLTCLSRIMETADRRDLSEPQIREVRDIVFEKIETCIQTIVKELAEHDSAVFAEAYRRFRNRSHDLFELHERINTQGRRDALLHRCLQRLAQELTEDQLGDEDVRYIGQTLERIHNKHEKSSASTVIGRSVCALIRGDGKGQFIENDKKEKLSTGCVSDELIKLLIAGAKSVVEPSDAAIHAANILNAIEGADVDIPEWQKEELEVIVTRNVRSSTALEGSAEILLELAKYPSSTLKRIDTLSLDDHKVRTIFSANALGGPAKWIANLLVRAIPPLLDKERQAYEAVIEQIASMVREVPSEADQCLIWAHLASVVYWSRPDVSQYLIDQRIWPSYQHLRNEEQHSGVITEGVLVGIAPVVWCAHRSLIEADLDALDGSARDRVCFAICDYLTKGRMLGEPAPPPGYWRKMSYEALVNLCEVLGKMESDSGIWGTIKDILDADERRQFWWNLPPKQQDAVVSKLDSLIASKLPAQMGVEHHGYKVLSEIAVGARLRREKWTDASISDRVEEIGNTADCAYIYSQLAGILPTRSKGLRESCVERALEKIKEIPSAAERLERAQILISSSGGEFSSRVRAEVDGWFRASLGQGVQGRMVRNQRDLVDTVYRFDEEWGASLASIAEEEAVNERTRTAVGKIRDQSQLEGSVREDSSYEPSKEEIDEYVKVFWKALAVSNVDEFSALQRQDLSIPLGIAMDCQLDRVLPVYAFHCMSRIRQSPLHVRSEAAREMFGVFQNVLRLVLCAVEGPIRKRWQVTSQQEADGAAAYTFVGVDGKERALKFIRAWLAEQECEELLIVDPYMDLNELEVIRYGQEGNADIEVTVVGGKDIAEAVSRGEAIASDFRYRWSQRYGGEAMPQVNLCVPHFASDMTSPLHDRWLLTEKGGLKLGTSINGLGNRDSSISVLRDAEYVSTYEWIKEYLHGKIKQARGSTVRYFSLPLA